MFRNTFRDDPFFTSGGFSPDFPDIDSFFNDGLDRRHRRQPDGRRRDERSRRDNAVEPFGGGMMDIFGDMNQMMSQMHSRFNDFHQQMQRVESNPNQDGHFYSSSTVYSYDGRGNEPHIYQAHTSTRGAPGGIRETQKALKDSRTGEEKMAIGHHIKDRGVVREKRRNLKTKEENEREDLIGIDHEELPQFTREWESAAPRRNDAIGAAGRAERRGRREARALPEPRRH